MSSLCLIDKLCVFAAAVLLWSQLMHAFCHFVPQDSALDLHHLFMFFTAHMLFLICISQFIDSLPSYIASPFILPPPTSASLQSPCLSCSVVLIPGQDQVLEEGSVRKRENGKAEGWGNAACEHAILPKQWALEREAWGTHRRFTEIHVMCQRKQVWIGIVEVYTWTCMYSTLVCMCCAEKDAAPGSCSCLRATNTLSCCNSFVTSFSFYFLFHVISVF